ncbi:N-6 DNA methylase [Amycolatopsis arida]|nr:N-6 DNA methylase [Amycolatopsis arida]
MDVDSVESTVSAGDIARLVDVGRAAVSNWRRRYADFPRPVGGTASSPLFSLAEVEEWLRRNGKRYELSAAERAWQRLRATGGDLRLGELVLRAGEALLAGVGTADWPDPELPRLLDELAAERGPADGFEFLYQRYAESHPRRLGATDPAVADIMAGLVCSPGATVLDPACGTGTLLLRAPAGRVLGQEVDGVAAGIATVRLRLRERDADIVAADSLRADAFADVEVDTVVCDPPFHERGWGFAELTSDPRWVHGVPPRGEPELAWAQHCLAHVRPGGLVAILMPPVAASRRSGRRIRGNLLRAGALRAVVTLGAAGPDLWVLRRPAPGDPPPAHLLLLDAADDPAAVLPAWRAHLAEPAAEPALRIVDLLDDHIDVSPARHRRRGGPAVADEYHAAARRLRGTALVAPDLGVAEPAGDVPGITVGELAKAGLLTIRHAPARVGTGGGPHPVLTADDLAAGRPPGERAADATGLVEVRPGDVVASPAGLARVATAPAFLGPGLIRVRVDPARLDPDFLAGVLRTAPRPHTASTRIDVRRTRLPRLGLAEQRRYGRAFRELVVLSDGLQEAAELGERVVRLGFDGLITGALRPR